MGLKASQAGSLWRFFTGLNVLVALALAAALLVFSNYLVRNPVLRVRVDLSPGALFTLSPETREHTLGLLRELDQTVTVEAFFAPHPHILQYIAQPGPMERARWDAQAAIRGQLQEFTTHLLSVYEVESRNRVRTRIYYTDREIQAASQAAQRLEVHNRLDPLNDLIVVSAGKRREVFTTREMGIERDPEARVAGMQRGTPRLVAFTGEEALSSRIRSAVLASSPKVLFLKGQREIEPDSMGATGLEVFVGLLRQEGFDLGVLELRREGRIPPDCDILVVLQPQARLATEVEDEIRRWLVEDGGRLFVAHGYSPFQVDLSPLVGPVGLGLGARPILSAVLDRERTGPPVLTGDERALYTLAIDLSNTHPITEPLGRSGRFLEVGNTLEVSVASSPPPGVSTWRLATTNPICWEGPPTLVTREHYWPVPGVAPTESFHVAAAGQVLGPDADARPGRAVLLGSSDALRSFFLVDRNPANQDFLINAFNWLADRTERVTVSPRDRRSSRLDPITPQQARRLRLTALVFFPGAVLLAGLVVFLIRRR